MLNSKLLETMKHILLFIFLLSQTILFAQVPNYINYQGAARTSPGDPLVQSTIALRISILDNASNGTALYTETFSTVTDNNGLFTILIGNGTPVTGTFASIDWSTNKRYLKVEMQQSSTYLTMGVSQLVSVPYALYAASAGNASQWINNSSDIYYTNGTNRKISSRPEGFGIENLGTNGSSEFIMRGANSTYSWHLEGTDNVTNSFRLFSRNYPSETLNNYHFVAKADGKFGVGTNDPRTSFHVANGDVYIDNSANGIILTSPNGGCWRVTVDNTGNLVRTSITCP